MKRSIVEWRWKKVCQLAIIEDLRFHDLRHEATSRLFERGLDVMEVASITGHRTLVMLARYTHLKAATLAAKLGRCVLTRMMVSHATVQPGHY